MKNTSPDNITRVAVPYYGTLSLLPSRLTRIFFLVEVDLLKMCIADLGLQVWDPEKEPSLSSWLRQMGTEGLICSDASSQQKMALLSDGIWVQSQQEGEVHEVVERWLRATTGLEKKGPEVNPQVVRRPSALRPKFDHTEFLRHSRTPAQRRPENSSPQQASRPTVPRSKIGLVMEREYCLGR